MTSSRPKRRAEGSLAKSLVGGEVCDNQIYYQFLRFVFDYLKRGFSGEMDNYGCRLANSIHSHWQVVLSAERKIKQNKNKKQNKKTKQNKIKIKNNNKTIQNKNKLYIALRVMWSCVSCYKSELNELIWTTMNPCVCGYCTYIVAS